MTKLQRRENTRTAPSQVRVWGCAWRGWSTALRLRCSRARASYYVAAAAQRSGHWVLGRDGRPGRPTQNTKLARACTVGSSVAMIFRKVLGGNNIWRPIEEPTTSDSIAGVDDEPRETKTSPLPVLTYRNRRWACPANRGPPYRIRICNLDYYYY
jgi:hypothetical protein